MLSVSFTFRCRAAPTLSNCRNILSPAVRRERVFFALFPRVASTRTGEPIASAWDCSSAWDSHHGTSTPAARGALLHSKCREGSPVHWIRSQNFDKGALSVVFCSNIRTRRYMDRMLGYCYLCNEPVQNFNSHSGYWEHVTSVCALYFAIAYRRQWRPDAVLMEAIEMRRIRAIDAVRLIPSFCHSDITQRWLRNSSTSCAQRELAAACATVQHSVVVAAALPRRPTSHATRYESKRSAPLAAAAGGSLQRFDGDAARALEEATLCFPNAAERLKQRLCPAVVEPAAMQRRRELLATLWKLTEWGVLTFAFSEIRDGSGGNGERMLRETVSRLSNQMVPPISAQAMTRWQQKAWGRQNLEVMFDLLHLGDVFQMGVYQGRVSCVATSKDQKGAVMRQLAFELHCATDIHAAARRRGRRGNGDKAQTACPPDDVVELVAEEALQRLGFELLYLRSSMLMDNTAGGMWENFGFVSYADAAQSEFTRPTASQ